MSVSRRSLLKGISLSSLMSALPSLVAEAPAGHAAARHPSGRQLPGR